MIEKKYLEKTCYHCTHYYGMDMTGRGDCGLNYKAGVGGAKETTTWSTCEFWKQREERK